MKLSQLAESCRPMRRVVSRAQAPADSVIEAPSSRKIVTVANGLSLLRPLIAGYIARNIASQKGKVRPLAAAMIATDAEGMVARKIDRHFTNSGRGATVYGTRMDVMADTGALLITAGALLVSPRTDVLSRCAIGLIGAQEAYKSIWATNLDRRYKKAFDGKHPPVAPTQMGKESMLEKLLAVSCALNAHETTGRKRTLYGISAMVFGVLGVMHAEGARRDYMHDIGQSLADPKLVPQPKA